MNKTDQLPILLCETRHDWEAWLEEHLTENGIWLKLAKKGTAILSITFPEALESALCFGWIDGQRVTFDEKHYLQKFTPRRPRSTWSKVNRQKIETLIADGRMRPTGLRQVELAKADGRWEAAYDAQSAMTVPDDFQKELEKNPAAQEFFATLKNQHRLAILRPIQTAIKPETRSARIQKYIAMLAAHEKPSP
ncbi:MAG TPA: YdeI/OmpD-associated family protein [Ktedonosporobacter sp.]|nr:YdeI/OmpD-associated family protein [Ktedonosporobacter sp.]